MGTPIPTNSSRFYVYGKGECQRLACELLVDLMKKGVYPSYTYLKKLRLNPSSKQYCFFQNVRAATMYVGLSELDRG